MVNQRIMLKAEKHTGPDLHISSLTENISSKTLFETKMKHMYIPQVISLKLIFITIKEKALFDSKLLY